MNLQGIKNRIRKILAYTITAVLFVLISCFLILQMPPVQNFLIGKYLKSLTQVTGFKSSVKSFRMLWFDRLELEGVNIYDPDNNKMIGVDRLLVNFKLSHLITHDDIDIDGLYVEGAQVLLTKVNASDTSRYLNINVFIDRISEQYASSSTDTTARSPKINIGEATVVSSSFIYIDAEEDSIKTGFDYYHFALDVDEGQLDRFMIQGDTTEFNVKTLIVTDRQTQFGVKQLTTFFRICGKSMEYHGINLKAGESTVTDTVIFTYDKITDLSEFVNKVDIQASLRNCSIKPKDLAVFAPGVESLGQTVILNGHVNGKVNKFKYTDMDFEIGNSKLRGSLAMDGLPDIYETFIVLNLKNSTLSFPDIAFLLNDQAMAQLTPLGSVSLQGQFLGYPNDFVAKATIDSRLGKISSDINLKIDEADFDNSIYSGRLALVNFSLGRYLNDTTTFQQLNLNGRIKGSGFKTSNADFTLDGNVQSIGLNGYNYTNITTNARFASEFFSGALAINDPNLEFKAKGSIDLRQNRNRIKIQGSLDTAFLQNLKLADENIFLQSDLDVNMTGLELDSLVGTADLKNFNVKYQGEELSLKNIHINSQKNGKQRAILLESTILDAVLQGNFLFTDISLDAKIVLDEFLLNIRNNKQEIVTYYQNKIHRPKEYEAKFNVKVKKIDALATLMDLDLRVARNQSINGSFSSGRTSIFRIYAAIDSFHYAGTDFYGTDFEITASKISDSTNVLAMGYINSNQQVFGENFRTKNLLIEGIWNKDHIDFGVDAEQEGQNNSMRLKGAVNFKKDSTQISFLPSSLTLLERVWTFSPENQILFTNNEWSFENVVLMNSDQSLGLNGYLSSDSTKKIFFTINQFDLSALSALSGMKFMGTLNARTNLSNYYTTPSIENDIYVDSLVINDFLIGNITGKNLWNSNERRFNVNFLIDRLNSRIIDVGGFYDPSNNASPLNLTASLKDANLKIIEPFLSDFLSQWGGTISGEYKITGTPNEPEFNGEGEITNGQVMINYLKTQYRFKGNVVLGKNLLKLDRFELTDGLKNKATLNGEISHTNFTNTHINLSARYQNLQVLNTSLKDNELFYGSAYATGRVSIVGPVANLKISATARSEKNTRIYIPIGGSSSVTKKEFINFVSFSDSTFMKNLKKVSNNKIDLSGLTLDLNLDITPDAYCEIIFDQKVGDIIRGRGNGDLQLHLDTKGEFNMFGVFEFTEGFYNFTLYDIINKEFQIQKGSRITWFGDPYAGTLNINASYNQLASFGPILSDQSIASSPQIRRKYPVQVILKLDGPMLASSINFDIVAKDLPQNINVEGKPVRLDFEFNAFKSKLDEQELNRQVFSLIALRRFSPPDAFNTSGSLANSVSELFSNQLSNWMTQVDENLEVDVDLGSFDEEAFNSFQVRVSYSALNGRLRLTRDGTFNSQNTAGGSTNTNNASSLVGDWTVDYMLTADGKFRVKIYNRTNVNPITSSTGTQNTYTTGISLSYVQSFNEIKDLLRSSRNRRRREMEKEKEREKEREKTLPNKDALNKKESDGTD